MSSELETNIVSVERVKEYSETPTEVLMDCQILRRSVRDGVDFEKKAMSTSLKITGPGLSKGGYCFHKTNHYPVDSVVCFVNTYKLDNRFIWWIA